MPPLAVAALLAMHALQAFAQSAAGGPAADAEAWWNAMGNASAEAALAQPPCDVSKYLACNDGKTCVPLYMKCDSQRQCPDGSDETDAACALPCPHYAHRCDSGQCSWRSAVCDGSLARGCSDASDETDQCTRSGMAKFNLTSTKERWVEVNLTARHRSLRVLACNASACSAVQLRAAQGGSVAVLTQGGCGWPLYSHCKAERQGNQSVGALDLPPGTHTVVVRRADRQLIVFLASQPRSIGIVWVPDGGRTVYIRPETYDPALKFRSVQSWHSSEPPSAMLNNPLSASLSADVVSTPEPVPPGGTSGPGEVREARRRGLVATPGQFRHHVLIEGPATNCSGSIITLDWVLTAATPIDYSSSSSSVILWKVWFAVHHSDTRERLDHNQGNKWRRPEQFVFHEKYIRRSMISGVPEDLVHSVDLALVKVRAPIHDKHGWIMNARPPKLKEYGRFGVGARLVVTGFVDEGPDGAPSDAFAFMRLQLQANDSCEVRGACAKAARLPGGRTEYRCLGDRGAGILGGIAHMGLVGVLRFSRCKSDSAEFLFTDIRDRVIQRWIRSVTGGWNNSALSALPDESDETSLSPQGPATRKIKASLKPSMRVRRGLQAEEMQFPHAVFIQYEIQREADAAAGEEEFAATFCTGGLISAYWILTVAACVREQFVTGTATAGIGGTVSAIGTAMSFQRQIRDLVKPGVGFAQLQTNGALGVVQVTQSFLIQDPWLVPIPLPHPDHDRFDLQKKIAFQVTGYGSSSAVKDIDGILRYGYYELSNCTESASVKYCAEPAHWMTDVSPTLFDRGGVAVCDPFKNLYPAACAVHTHDAKVGKKARIFLRSISDAETLDWVVSWLRS